MRRVFHHFQPIFVLAIFLALGLLMYHAPDPPVKTQGIREHQARYLLMRADIAPSLRLVITRDDCDDYQTLVNR